MAYGASLESWLGASPHGFESHILRVRSERVERLGDRNHHWCVRTSGFTNETVKKPQSNLGLLSSLIAITLEVCSSKSL